MYSVVLMMSLTGGMEAPDFGRCRCSCSCSGYSSCRGYSSCHGCHGGRRARRCHGCCGGYGCSGGRYGCCGGGGCGGGAMPPAGERVPAPKKTQADDRATIVVNLPADARLTVGGQPTTSTSSERRFITPPLATDRDSHYTFRAEIVRDGQTVSVIREVAVRPGEETQVTLDFAPAGVAAAR
jgi:uncharacterized protein (TIGR03000 family)